MNNQYEELIKVLREAEGTCKKLAELAQRAGEIAGGIGDYTARGVGGEITRIARNMEGLAYGQDRVGAIPNLIMRLERRIDELA